MKIVVAAIQMPSDPLDVSANLHRADELLRSAHDEGVELAVLPELFNTGYSLCPDYGPYSETVEGPTITHLRRRSRQWRMAIAAGFVERSRAASLRFAGVLRARRRDPDLSQAQPRLLGTVPIPSRPIAAGRLHALGTRRFRDLRRHDLSQGLERLSRSDRPGGRLGGLARTSPIATPGAGTGCSATSARSRRRSRRRSPRTWACP